MFPQISRHVDFNQGLDARLFDKENAAKLGEIAVNPCRIAFDSLDMKEEYLTAMTLAYESGVRKFSNYLLYNYEEDPKDLWERLNINIQFCRDHTGASLFSFPMRYASISDTNRSYVGKKWHKKYLRAMNVILNVTSGIVAKEEDFFKKAYGESPDEFIQILTMPDEFIRYRVQFEKCGQTKAWKKDFACLTEMEKEQLLDILDRMVDEPDILENSYSKIIDKILGYYRLKKKDALAMTG